VLIDVLLDELQSFHQLLVEGLFGVVFTLSTLIAKPTTHSLYSMVLAFSSAVVGPNAIVVFLACVFAT
jgi:hypothetical protein